MKFILSLDGGGAKGIMQSVVLTEIEHRTGKRICDLFDLIVGTSVGAIQGGILASGKVGAWRMGVEMRNILPKAFSPRLRVLFLQPKYSRKELENAIAHFTGPIHMGSCKTKFMCTSVDICTEKTHFFKSWDTKPYEGFKNMQWKWDAGLPLIEAINRSYAAPLYFGQINDEQRQMVWVDGGTGNMNCPLDYAIIEAFNQGWVASGEQVRILSIGTGTSMRKTPYKDVKMWKNFRQVIKFASPAEGGLARMQMEQTKLNYATFVEKATSNVFVCRANVKIAKEIDVMDKTKFIPIYEKCGEDMVKNLPWEFFKV